MSTFNYSPLADDAGNSEHSEMEMRLWDYIDGNSTAEEKNFVEELIASNLEWKKTYKELLEVHQMVSGNLELDAPSMRFTKNVMEEIGKFQIAPAAKSYINKKIIWGIAIFFFTMIAGFLVYSFGQVDWSTGNDSPLPFKVPQVEWNKFFNNTYTNIFLMVNVVLGLMLLDMYLGKKRKQLIAGKEN
jgi:magnesium-transporting ATPase (P-type)